MQVDSCGKLLRCVLQITRIVERFRSMHQSHDSWISDYARSFHQIDTGLDPDLFQATAAAFASLLLMHKNSPDCDWLRPSVKRKKKKKKSKKKSRKRSDDDDDDDENQDSDDTDDNDGLSSTERNEIDEQIIGNEAQPMINLTGGGDGAQSLEKLLESHFTFVPYIKPLLFERLKNEPRLHDGIKYSLMLIVHTCANVTETLVMLKKCHKKILLERSEKFERLGYETEKEVCCRILLLGWGNIYKSSTERNYRDMKASLAELNRIDHSGVSYEFFSVEELQHDITKGNAEQFVVLNEKNTSAEERARLRTIETHQMRRLETTDPQAAIRDFVVGQRVRIQRSHVHLGAGSVEYAQVVDSTPT